MLLLMVMVALLVAGLLFARPHRVGVLAVLAGAILIEILGMVYVIRLSKKQSIALGFVCPLCGGVLYDGRSNRLSYRRECPCCKQFIIERLNEDG